MYLDTSMRGMGEEPPAAPRSHTVAQVQLVFALATLPVITCFGAAGYVLDELGERGLRDVCQLFSYFALLGLGVSLLSMGLDYLTHRHHARVPPR